MTPDYLSKIRHAKSLHMIALYMRAQACQVNASLMTARTPFERFQNLREKEQQASFIENNCNSLADARKLLREWGYLK